MTTASIHGRAEAIHLCRSRGDHALGGQHADYVAIQLKAYKSGERTTDPNAVMRTIAGRLSSNEIEAVSSYVEGLH